MKKILILFCLAGIATAMPVQARPMSAMEWVDPKSMDIWRSLSAAEKTQSVHAMMSNDPADNNANPMAGMASGMAAMGSGFSGEVPAAERPKLETKVQACLDKEIADPDYQGVPIPAMTPFMYCSMKYSAIISARQQNTRH